MGPHAAAADGDRGAAHAARGRCHRGDAGDARRAARLGLPLQGQLGAHHIGAAGGAVWVGVDQLRDGRAAGGRFLLYVSLCASPFLAHGRRFALQVGWPPDGFLPAEATPLSLAVFTPRFQTHRRSCSSSSRRAAAARSCPAAWRPSSRRSRCWACWNSAAAACR